VKKAGLSNEVLDGGKLNSEKKRKRCCLSERKKCAQVKGEFFLYILIMA